MRAGMISYADNHEDVLLARALDRGRDTPGFYIDVGAYDPVDHSVTKHFYDRGWRGINIEPNPAPFARLAAERERDINLNLGVSDADGELLLYEAPDACWSVDRRLLTGWFGARADQIRERRIPVTTLAKVCAAHVPAGVAIDFLKVDVEGHEAAVLAGNDWTRFRPRVLVVENSDVERWEPPLLGHAYRFAYFDGVNRYYVREEDRALVGPLSLQPNVGDFYQVHGYLHHIELLRRELAEVREAARREQERAEALAERCGDLTPGELRLARWVRHARLRHPRLASAVRPLVRRLVG